MRVVLWLRSPDFRLIIRSLNTLAFQYGNINILGAFNEAQPNAGIVFNGNQLPMLDKNSLKNLDYDLIIVGGSEVGIETAMYLAENNHNVPAFQLRTASRFGAPNCRSYRWDTGANSLSKG